MSPRYTVFMDGVMNEVKLKAQGNVAELDLEDETWRVPIWLCG